MFKLYIAFFVFVLLVVKESSAIWCYRCTSATPGCGDHFDWRGIGFLGEQCPNDEDICVKVTERRGAKETITRDCLSTFTNLRTDIPADKYEGCRPAVPDELLAHYVNHTVKEHDVKRNFYPNVTYCFCFLDHRCNSAISIKSSKVSILIASIVTLICVYNKLFK